MNFIVAKNMTDKIIYKLEEFGSVYMASKLNIEDESVSYHPDMQIHFVDDFYAICPEEMYDHYYNVLPKAVRLEKGNSSIGITYPRNCAYNIARVGKNIICNSKISDRKILDYYTRKGFKIINVKQGYAKCNIAPVGEDLFITEDAGIYKTALSHNIKCLLIPNGDVSLKGFDYGFIGGATGYADGKLLLCGKAPDGLKAVLYENDIDFLELYDGKLWDFGSIISFG